MFLDAPEFDAEAAYRMSKALAEHGRYLSQWTQTYRSGNWQVIECTGLALLGIMFPEFQEAAQWRERRAAFSLVEHMQKDVGTDGMHWEMAPSYHSAVWNSYLVVAQLCRRNGISVPGLLDRHEKMLEVLMQLCRPDGHVFPLGDTHEPLDIRGVMGQGALLYGRADMRSLATDAVPPDWIWLFGPQVLETYPALAGQTPAFTSALLPDARYAALRTGWGKQDACLLFDCAPWRGGHCHLDALQVLLYAGGRDLLIDPGIGDYDAEASRTYMRTTAAHNVLLIDGREQPQADAELVVWETTGDADFASGKLSQNGVTHQRSVLFIKPGYWIVMDTVTPDLTSISDGQHELTRFFHLPPDADAQADACSVSTGYAQGVNLHILTADAPDAPTEIQLRTGYVPGPRRTALDAPVIVFVNKVSLPTTLCALLVPVSDPSALPTAARIPTAEDGQQVHLRITFPDGQQEEVVISNTPQMLRIGEHATFNRALCVQQGPQANAIIALGAGIG